MIFSQKKMIENKNRIKESVYSTIENALLHQFKGK